MTELAGWIAPIATTIAAMMTAANLGARVTGLGFIIFTIGSISWALVGVGNGQPNLLWTNVFLTLVNAIGIWRWLGRQARYDDGGAAAARQSAASRVPTLFSASSMIGKPVSDTAGQEIGSIIDVMARCHDGGLAYVVVSEGGIGGVGERLHALDPAELTFTSTTVKTRLTEDLLRSLPVIDDRQWPTALPRAKSTAA